MVEKQGQKLKAKNKWKHENVQLSSFMVILNHDDPKEIVELAFLIASLTCIWIVLGLLYSVSFFLVIVLNK